MNDKWDRRFLEMARLTASWSKDPSTKCGAVIVRENRSICSLGYNGFPRSIVDDMMYLENRELKLQRIIHCEMNAVLNAQGGVQGCTLYTIPSLSCCRCAVHMIQAGITRAVGPIPTGSFAERWADDLAKTRELFTEAGVLFTEIDLP